MQENERTVVVRDTNELASPPTRRGFLRALGLGGSVVLLPSVFAACEDSVSSTASTEVINGFNAQQTVTIDLSNDVGIFRFATVLEQLEQAFYNQFTSSSQFQALFPAIADQEAIIDIRNDENVHRTFLDAALGSNRLPQLTFNFGDAFSSRANFLAAARQFTNTGVSAYNGAGRFIKDVNNLLVSGKIVSVEGRHASTLQDLDDAANQTGAGEPTGRRFADLTYQASLGFTTNDALALDDVLTFTQVYAKADPFVVQPIQLTNVPA
jgi:hypothetical protein